MQVGALSNKEQGLKNIKEVETNSNVKDLRLTYNLVTPCFKSIFIYIFIYDIWNWNFT